MRRPTFCSSVEQHQSAGPTPSDKESRLSKMKRMITGGILMGRKKRDSEGEKENSDGVGEMMETDGVSVCLRKEAAHGQPLKEVHIEVSASATTEIVLKPRKRKERLDSGGSVDQETKVIRSSSEERPEVKSNTGVRRVWSHEELCALTLTAVNANGNTGAPVTSQAERQSVRAAEPLRQLNHCPGEELEARRSSERFSRGRCAAPRRRKVSRRALPPERPSSPSAAPKLDVESLHQQMEGGEPLTSRGKILSPDDEPESPTVEALISPRNSLVMRLTYLDPNLPPSPPQNHSVSSPNMEQKERRLTRQINSIKRQLKRYEEGFRVEFGYKPSQSDKMANKDIKRLCGDMAKLRSQLNQIRDDAAENESAGSSNIEQRTNNINNEREVRSPSPNNAKMYSKSNKTMEEALLDVHKKLQEKRFAGSRGSEIQEMSREQLLEEKLAVQKALLSLENSFGRPVDANDRDLVRPLYQRYRALKRLVIRTTSGKLNNSTSELATILEHETMEFTASASVDIPEPAVSAEEETEVQPEYNEEDSPAKNADCIDDTGASSSSSDSLAENIHALPLSQLLEQEKRVKDDKKRLRRRLREFENQFQSETGRRAQKQDRVAIESIYLGYKQAKAKLRLLEALIAKKSQVKRNSC